MKSKQLIIISIVALLFSCSSTHLIQPDELIHIEKYGTLYKTNLEKIDISEFYTSNDSIIALDIKTNELLEYSKSDVNKIVITDRSKGSKKGAIYSAIGAALLVLILPDNPDDALGSRGAGLIIAPPIYGSMGALVGFANGYSDIYIFDVPKSNNINAMNKIKKTQIEQTLSSTKEMKEEQKIETKEIKKKMIIASEQPVKKSYIQFSFGPTINFGKIPAINNTINSVLINESGPGFGGIYQLWIPIRSNIYFGFSASGFGASQESDNITTTQSVENFGLTTRIYSKKKNFYYEGSLGYSRLSQKSKFSDKLSDFFDSSISGKNFIAGMGTSIIQGEKFEIVLSSDISFNFFDNSKSATFIGINIDVLFPRQLKN